MASALPAVARAPILTPSPRVRPSSKPAPAPLQTPRLSVVIVNYCLWEETGLLVRDLAGSPCMERGDAEVVIVDNHSPTHPMAARLRHTQGVALRRWGRNR